MALFPIRNTLMGVHPNVASYVRLFKGMLPIYSDIFFGHILDLFILQRSEQ